MEKLTGVQRRALGSVLRGRREALGWTQAELARQVKLARAYISHIESGSKAPSMAVLARYCSVVGVTPADVLNESGLSRPHAEGIDPRLLEGIRRLPSEIQDRLVTAWPALERFLLTLCADGSGPQSGG